MSLRHVSGPTLADLEREVRALAGGRARQKAMGILGRVLTAEHREAFAREASPAGVPWLPLRRARPGKILHREGALERGATRPVFRGATLAFLLPAYGARHNFGYPKGATPARPFMALDPLPFAILQRLQRAINEMLAGQLR